LKQDTVVDDIIAGHNAMTGSWVDALYAGSQALKAEG
jgi:hypothetical protein